MMKMPSRFRPMHWIRASRVCALLALAGALLAVSAPVRCADGTWVATGSLHFPRAGHAATLLRNGKVLVVGGAGTLGVSGGTSAEIYDPATGKWTLTGTLGVPRSDPTATMLNNGQVLVVGGDYGEASPQSLGLLGTCELYDPATGTWSKTASLNTPRDGFTATLLANGEVLVAGGVDGSDAPLDTAEIYDPVRRTWRYTGSFGGARSSHAAARLADGKVLLVGGFGSYTAGDFFPVAIGGGTVYDPVTGTWSGLGGLYTPRAQSTATLLANGHVLVAGGYAFLFDNHGSSEVSYALADLFDPIGDWNSTGPMNARRTAHTATLLPNGQVLVTGGSDSNGASSELYDPMTGTWHVAASMQVARSGHTATLLPDGRVLVVGGSAGNALASAEIFEPGNVTAATISAAVTGAWYDPAQSGHGLFIEVLPGNRFLASWFAFDPSGKQQAWFTGVGTYSGNNATITNVLMPTGGRFIPNFDAADVTANRWGSLTFTFTDCNHGRVDFNSVLGYGSGSMNISRLAQPAGLACP
ncbi:MAG TPA: kelch repeat-containing protein [Casimicrobiaceae bacterium]